MAICILKSRDCRVLYPLLLDPDGLPLAAAPAAACADGAPKPVAIVTFLPARHGLARAAARKAGLSAAVAERAFLPCLFA